jgi:hypothetical protein
MANHRLGTGWSLSLPALLSGLVFAAGCASEVDADGSSLSGSGGAGASAAGGATAGGAGGAGGQSLCAQDCSEIDTPPCLVAVCNEGEYPGQVGACAVVDAPAGTECDDGLFCTVNDTCSAGACVGGPQNDCDLNPPPCTEITCVESTQSCTTAPAENDAPCIPEDLCQVNGTCQSGLCVGHPKDCSFSPLSECNTVSCDSTTGACTATAAINDGQGCALTGDLCMSGKTCSTGQCVGGSPKDCSAFTNGCNNGACNAATGNCFSDPVAPGGACLDGVAQCEVGTCEIDGTCTAMPAMNGASCDDGNACTVTDVCGAGICAGTPDPGYTVYFTETFANNSAGWMLDTDWEIGPTSPSSGGTGNPDPALDHTPTGDNGVAGVVLGGTAPTNLHPFYYLTSPIINTGAASGDVYLEFFRWLNSDYLPYMQNVIEVYNGSTWVQVWASGSSPGIMDDAWNKQTYNITAHKNANMRVRWGFTIGSSGVYTISQWNVDDVTVASAPCN